jgi:deoxyadenosine/deoxycytidine kinase
MKIAIEANIGCGKTTLLNEIAKRDPSRKIILEPVDTDWKEGLNLFYKDSERWGFTFNINVLKSYHKHIHNNNTAIYERSPLSSYHVFSQIQYEQGKMTQYEHELFEYIHSQMSWMPDILIYIRTSPKTCFERMINRGRECEAGVPLEYLTLIHDKYDKMIEELSTNENVKIYIVDGEQNINKVCTDVMTILQQLDT